MIDELAFYTFFALLLIAPLASALVDHGRHRWTRWRRVFRPV